MAAQRRASTRKAARPASAAAVGFAVAQFAPTDDRAANLAVIRRLAAVAAQRGASVVVLPEYSSFFVDPLGPELVAAGEALDGPFVQGLGEIARKLGVHLVAGMVESVDDGERIANTLVAVEPGGAVVATYRKLHLYDAFGQTESDWVAPGEIGVPQTFEVGGLVVGLQTCYDLRFPEVTRWLVDAGADVVAAPAEWVRGPLKEAHWRTLVTARALENTIYLVAADQTPPIGVGTSMIVDPMGVEIATLGEVEDVAVAWLSQERIAAAREKNPALALRRFEVRPVRAGRRSAAARESR
ncbi:carbon-nitrogen hydrolase family protein [Rathayibacter sp. VKM Ac-2928]|uniref:carbon-nitrogen hydrolase family protein n=1 Tax=Rathayibacter sp. VKM Ac-2928 TaxID=2929479 RepID=UPI001FB4BAD8|nr:carbon-nitrogen hydrolase family protein [Rathayibacter sp. VKM Ac-2928]MCJ1685098.1 carbon-nitrogen hydrolase family protein [Rathayibacter sp. VKM Ac-2928]